MVWSKPHHHARGNERKREGQSMPRVDFDQLPDDARLWIFTAERSLSDTEQAQLLTEVDRFIGQWGAHDVPLTAARELRYDRFLSVAVDQRKVGPSGCSIDALVRQTKALEQEIGIELVSHAPVVFRQGSAIERVPRDQFAELAAAGKVGLETTVFDNTLTCVRKLPRQVDTAKGDCTGGFSLGRNVRGGTRPRLSCGRSWL